jgi:hypothetical protein
MRISKLLTLAIVPLALACRVDDTAVEEPWTDPALEAPAEAPEMREMDVNLTEVEGSGVGGEAHLRQLNGQTEVTVRVEDAPASASLDGHIHRGTCGEIGEVVVALQSIQTNADGQGQATSTVNIPGLANGEEFVVVYHSGPDMAPIVCGEIDSFDNGRTPW